MSTIKTNNVQVGNSGTASNNFTWYQPTVPDGTVRLGQGNSGATTSDILVVSSTGLSIGGSSIPASRIVQGTAQATTSGSTVGFTGIPSWVKRVTLILDGVVSTSASQPGLNIQLGSGSYQTTGYTGVYSTLSGSVSTANSATSSFQLYTAASTNNATGLVYFDLIGSNTWVCSGMAYLLTGGTAITNGRVALSGALDRIQIVTAAGTWSAGSINIIYEG